MDNTVAQHAHGADTHTNRIAHTNRMAARTLRRKHGGRSVTEARARPPPAPHRRLAPPRCPPRRGADRPGLEAPAMGGGEELFSSSPMCPSGGSDATAAR